MKICFITTVKGTLRAFVTAQAEYIKKHHPDWEIYFVCTYDEEFANELPEFIHYVPLSISRGIDFKGLITVLKLTKFFKKEKFDMITYATPNASMYSSLAGRLAGVKKRLYCQWGIRYVGFSGTKRKIFKFLEKLVCTNSTYINAVSPRNRQFSIDEGLYKPEKAVVVGNGGTIGVDLTAYDMDKYDAYRKEKREELGLKDEFVFGFVGRLSKDKGTFELFKAAKKLSEKYKDFKLVCVGRSELEDVGFYDDLKDWVENSGTVILTGRKPKEEVVKYYATIDVYVHPTYREGFGMVLQEAGAMSCPVITTDIPGAGEVLVEGESCLLAKPKDVDSLVKKMEYLYNNQEYCRTLGRNARKYVEEKYNRETMLRNQLNRYEELLSK